MFAIKSVRLGTTRFFLPKFLLQNHPNIATTVNHANDLKRLCLRSIHNDHGLRYYPRDEVFAFRREVRTFVSYA